MTPTLASQRCWTHAEREAVARCVECRRYFCRECATEHDGRLLCVGCLAAAAAKLEGAVRTRWSAWVLAAAAGLASAFLIFYSFGYLLEQLPPEWSSDSRQEAAR